MRLLASIFFLVPALFSAAPVVHVLCSDIFFKVCRPAYSAAQRASFIRGTLLPDIRYLAHIKREKTHVKRVQLATILETQDPYLAGKLFHSFVDEAREKIAQKKKVYTLGGTVPYKTKFIKFAEDIYCYTKISPQLQIVRLQNFDDQEYKQGIPFNQLRTWHKQLSSYFQENPSALFKERIKQHKGYMQLTSAQVASWQEALEKVLADKRFTHYVDFFLNEFEKQLTSKVQEWHAQRAQLTKLCKEIARIP